jgi:hypothetical protein
METASIGGLSNPTIGFEADAIPILFSPTSAGATGAVQEHFQAIRNPKPNPEPSEARHYLSVTT